MSNNTKNRSKPILVTSDVDLDIKQIVLLFSHRASECVSCGGVFRYSRKGAEYCSKYCIDRERHLRDRYLPCTDCGTLGYWGRKTGETSGRCRNCVQLPMNTAYMTGDYGIVLDAIHARVAIQEITGCWEWQNAKHADGYGMFSVPSDSTKNGKRGILVHRAALEASLGREILSYEPVHHKCANRLCCNPEHLQVVTPQENLAEMMERSFYQERISALEDVVADQQKQINELTAQLAAITNEGCSL